MKLTVLATSSSGNASIVTGENETIALDFGLSFKKWHTLLEKYDLKEPDELFITHSHGDHANESGLSRLIKVMPTIKIHTNRGTFETAEFEVEAFLVAHDVECHSFIITEKATKEKLVYATDVNGLYETFTREDIFEHAKDADVYALEANFDNRWLKFPEYLDQVGYKYNVFANMVRHTSKQESIKTFSALKKSTSKYVPLHMSSRFYNFS